MKICIIGDIHGRSIWQAFADIRYVWKTPHVILDYDLYIFLGDYVDSFGIGDDEIYQNLKNIITFKQNYPDKVILLLGNHDIMYYFNAVEYGCSGYRPQMYPKLHKLFQKYEDLFQPVYQIGNCVFTHAGISSVWWNKVIKETNPSSQIPSEVINHLFTTQNPILYDVGSIRGGWNKSGGPFWADKSETMAWMFPNYHQIVGHTPIKEIFTHVSKDTNSSITYCDCVYDFYELKI